MKPDFTSSQVHFFCDNSDIEPTPPVITSMMSCFGSLNLIPTIGNEINGQTGEKRQFLIMVCHSPFFQIQFSRGEILFVSDSMEPNDFLAKTIECIEALSSFYPNKIANRLSYLESFLIPEYTNSKYKDAYNKLFINHTSRLAEWDYRTVERRVINNSEELNSISSVRCCEVASHKFNNGSFVEALLLDFDSNTVPHNITHRFTLKSCQSTLSELFQDVRKSATEIDRVIGS